MHAKAIKHGTTLAIGRKLTSHIATHLVRWLSDGVQPRLRNKRFHTVGMQSDVFVYAPTEVLE
ncbi:hypothetical protein CGZ80_26175 [Rhodopirellula sp. MGV]|nr:hypothetical protein CGZ80_26175 [Rhodopirellula sp. MGV]PNY38813.1 hypothetical protein C2E31_02620 [Rhodopirellula baltica]